MNVNDVYQSSSDSLKAEDLNSAEHTLTIAGYTVQNFKEDDGYEKPKIILSFQRLDKTLVLNKTNAGVIAAALGDDVDRWAGGEIILYPTVTDFGGKTVPCIRVRPVLKQASAPLGQPAQQHAGRADGGPPVDNYQGIG